MTTPSTPVNNSVPENTKTIVLLSGGLDSTVLLASLLSASSRYQVVLALTFDYGQRAVLSEVKASQDIATHFGIPHQTIALPLLQPLLPAALSPHNKLPKIPEPSLEALFDVNRVWVPNRNGLFLNIGAAYAEARQACHVAFGANQEEGEAFPDNTPAFREAINQSLSSSTLNQVKVIAPLEQMSKLQILAYGVQLGNVPFEMIWSCYEDTDMQCGACASCIRVKTAKSTLELTGSMLPIQFANTGASTPS
jgi:7-cyano-7-deazaguanine synthase